MVKRVMYIYKNTHLPKNGWLQGCFVCNTITSSYETYKITKPLPNMRYVLYCCQYCIIARQKSSTLEDIIKSQVENYVNLASVTG